MTNQQLIDEILKKLNEVSDLFTTLTDYSPYYDDFEVGLDKSISAVTAMNERRKIRTHPSRNIY